MVRHRKRITNKGSWDGESLRKAIEAVTEGTLSMRKAAAKHGIPFSTLQDRYKNRNRAIPRLGRKSIFTNEEEKEICKQALLLADFFHGLTPILFRRLVYDFAIRNGIPNSFNKEKQTAGKDWFYAFYRRHSKVLENVLEHKGTTDQSEAQTISHNLEFDSTNNLNLPMIQIKSETPNESNPEPQHYYIILGTNSEHVLPNGIKISSKILNSETKNPQLLNRTNDESELKLENTKLETIEETALKTESNSDCEEILGI